MNSEVEQRVRLAFSQAFDRQPDVVSQAPGRVNLIGEHTDYNGGFVLPCAIDFATVVAASRRDDDEVRVAAYDYGGDEDVFALSGQIQPDAQRGWPNYIRGVVSVLLSRGYALSGFDVVLSGDVPQGAGLSSSASLEVALLIALNELFDLALDERQIALLGQAAENDFVGCNCGIMDQMVSASAQKGHALLLDCRSLESNHIPMPADTCVMIIDSKIQRGLVDSAYNERRNQCEAAAAHFGVDSLRDLPLKTLEQNWQALGDTPARRARHVVTETERTQAAAGELVAGDIERLGVLMQRSHASMRDDFEITVPAIDALVDITQRAIGSKGGARMTGGGFGGCVVAVMDIDRADGVAAQIAAEYCAKTGFQETIYRCVASSGAGLLA